MMSCLLCIELRKVNLSVNIGIIGLGTIGKFVLNGAIQHPDYQVNAVYDINRPTLAELDTHQIDVMETVDELLNRDDIDIVYIGTPPNTHIDLCHQALHAGKALWCEKPLGIDLDESERLISRIERDNAIGAVNLSLATSPVIQLLDESVKTIPLNEHCSIEMQFHFSSWPRHWQAGASKWLSSSEQGGFLREVFSHFVFLQHRLHGQLEFVSSEIEYASPTSSESYVRANYLSNNIPVRLTCSIGGAAPERNEWTLFGKSKSVRYSGWNKVEIGDENGWSEIETENEGSVAAQLNEIKKLLNNKPNKLATFQEAFEVQKVVENTILRANK